jgi:hypothetical protein
MEIKTRRRSAKVEKTGGRKRERWKYICQRRLLARKYFRSLSSPLLFP